MTNFKHWTMTVKAEDFLLGKRSDGIGMWCGVCPANDYCNEQSKQNLQAKVYRPCRDVFLAWAEKEYKHSKKKKPRQPRMECDIIHDAETEQAEETT